MRIKGSREYLIIMLITLLHANLEANVLISKSCEIARVALALKKEETRRDGKEICCLNFYLQFFGLCDMFCLGLTVSVHGYLLAALCRPRLTSRNFSFLCSGRQIGRPRWLVAHNFGCFVL